MIRPPDRTPYQHHKGLDHKTTWYSPNGFDIIEQCTECLSQFLFCSGDDRPITLPPQKPHGLKECAK